MNLILPSIMQSIKPQYCELIAVGKKTYEVRKTRPKLNAPFKVYIYETKFINHCRDCEYCSFESIVMSRMKDVCQYEEDNWKITSLSSRCFQNKYSGGKVIGEYICDEIQEWVFDNEYTRSYDISDDDLALTCLTQEQLWEYGKGKTLYGYHISNLKIYDEPKELSEFKQCHKCPYGDISNCAKHDYSCDGTYKLTRPPQSWCYCEEV